MSKVVKIKIRNSSGISPVRFIGVQFDGSHFTADINDGDGQEISAVQNGSVSLTAFRVSDKQALDSLIYSVSDSLGFAAILLLEPDDANNAIERYRLLGEPFVIVDPDQC